MSFNNLSLTDEATFALNVSLSVARDSGHSEAELTHLASALFFMDESIGCTAVATAGQQISGVVNMKRLKRNIEKLIQKTASEDPLPLEAKLSASLETLLSSEEKQKSDGNVSVEDLLLLVYKDEGVSKLLHGKYKLSRECLLKLFAENRIHEKLDKYSIDLLKAARAGKIEKVVGRYEEIRETVKVLSSSAKSNVCLVGEPHVDVIAVVEGLALRISQGIVPESVDVSFRALNLDSIMAEADGLQQMQARLQEVLNEVKELKGRIIFFIDELHFVLGDETVEGMNAAALLGPFIENDDIRMIGAIYTEDFPSCIENHAVFGQSFQKVVVDELSTDVGNDEMTQMSFGNASMSTFGESGDIFDADANMSLGVSTALVTAAQLSNRYIINDNSSPSDNMKIGRSQRTLLRTQRTLSERFITLTVPSSGTDHAASTKKFVPRILRPENIIALERKIFNLEAQLKILRKTSDAEDEEQKLTLIAEIAEHNKSLEPQLITWQAQHVNELKRTKKNLESLENKAVSAEKSGDFDKAADLKFGAIPALRTRVQELAKVFGR